MSEDTQCVKCQAVGRNGVMKMQSETLTEQFWVCSNAECNNRFSKKTDFHETKETMTLGAATVAIGAALWSIFHDGHHGNNTGNK